MKRLTDPVIEHLRKVCDFPDLDGTPYHIIREIDRNPNRIIYEVADAKLGRRVAMKVLYAGDSVRVEDEARTMARIDHPGVATIHEAGRLSDGRVFYTMQIVDGRRLDQFLTSINSLSERLRIFQKICETVSFAHAKGVVHGSLAPKKILVGTFGEVLITGWSGAQFHGENTGRMLYLDVQALSSLLGFLIEPGAPPPLLAVARQRYGNASQLSGEITAFLDGRRLPGYREGWIERISRWVTRRTTR